MAPDKNLKKFLMIIVLDFLSDLLGIKRGKFNFFFKYYWIALFLDLKDCSILNGNFSPKIRI